MDHIWDDLELSKYWSNICHTKGGPYAERGGGRAARVARLSAKALYKSNRAARPHVAAQRCGAGVGRVGGL